MNDYNKLVHACESIEELCSTLNEINQSDDFDPDRNPDLTDLPLFGGDEPSDTLGVFSWSAEKLLWADGSTWSLTARNDEGKR